MFAGETGPGALAATARTVLKVQGEFVSQTGRAVTAPTRGSGLWLKFRVTMEGWSRCHCPNSRTQSTASIAPLIVPNNLGGKTESADWSVCDLSAIYLHTKRYRNSGSVTRLRFPVRRSRAVLVARTAALPSVAARGA